MTTNGPVSTITAATYDGMTLNFSSVVSTNTFILNFSAALDAFNNLAVTLTDFNFAVGALFPSLYSSTLPVGASVWTTPSLVYQGPIQTLLASFSLVISPLEKAYLGWATGLFASPNATFTTVNISVNGALFPPQPISALQVVLVKNQTLLQKDLVHVLTWTASTDLSVSSYLIYRNGQLIGQVAANTQFFEDHNRRSGEKDVYTVIASNSAGASSGVSVPFP